MILTLSLHYNAFDNEIGAFVTRNLGDNVLSLRAKTVCNDRTAELPASDLAACDINAAVFKNMVDNSPQGIMVHDRHRPLYVNRVWAELHGLTVAETMNIQDLTDLFHEDDRERLVRYKNDRLAGLDVPERYRYRALHRDGRAVWLECFVSLIAWRGRKITMVSVVDVDNEQRQAVELRRQRELMEYQALQRSEALTRSNSQLHIYQSVIDQMSERMSVVDTDYRFRMVNRATIDFYGGTRSQFIDKHISKVIGDRVFEERAKPMLDRVFQGQIDMFERSEIAPDGRRHNMLVMGEPFHDPQGRISGAIVSVRDITKTKEAEKQQHLFASVIEQSKDCVSVVDLDCRIRMTNKANSDFYRASQESIIGRPLSDLVGEDYFNRFSKPALERCFRGEEVRFRRPHKEEQGNLRTIEILLEPYREMDGRISGAIARLRDVTEAQAMSEKLAYQARYDQLTGLLNRQAFEQILEKSIADVSTSGRSDVLCFIDLDQFKIVNDTVGHLAGDIFLKQVAELLSSKLHDDDVPARFGGDEFVVMLKNCSLRRAERACDRLIRALTDYRFFHEGLVFRVGASIGITAVNRHATSAGDMLLQADLACYAAKDNGRNQVQTFKKRDAFIRRRQDDMYRAGRIRAALDEDRFVLFGQIIAPIQSDNQEPEHIEILLRQVDSGMKIVRPDAFIPAAERYGLMAELDRWVIGKTVACLTRPCKPLEDRNVSINLSGITLSDDTSLDFIRTTLTESGLSPERISFEITETAAIRNLAKTEAFIAELREWGCRFALDDFGSGLSSLNYLKRLPVDFLKIDGSFIRELTTDSASHAMVKAIIQMARDLNIKTVAEGVETRSVLSVLRPLGIDYVQGYGIHLPSPLQHDVSLAHRSDRERAVVTSSRHR